MKDKIWACLVNYKYKSYIIEILYKKYQKRDWWLNVFIALTSSSSIAAWAIWQKFGMLWALIIAISQVFTTIKPFLPYNKYIKELGSKCIKFDSLNLEYEKLWDSISRGKTDEDFIIEEYYRLKNEGQNLQRFSDEVFFDVSSGTDKQANERMSVFLKSNYNVAPQE